MKRLFILTLLPAAFFGQIRMPGTTPNVPATHAPVNFNADRLSHNGAVTQGQGHVRVTIDGLVFQANQANYRSDTGELDLTGNVEVTLPGRAEKSTFRFTIPTPDGDQPAALITDRSVRLTAVHMHMRSGQLQASQNIAVRAPEAQVYGDEMSMALRTADATLTGHVVSNGAIEKVNPQRKLELRPQGIK